MTSQNLFSRLVILFLSLSCYSITLFSFPPDTLTEFAPIGAEWVFDYESNPPGNSYRIGYQTVRVVGDTIIHGKYSKKLHWEKIYIDTASANQEADTLNEGFRYFHQQGDSVFYLNPLTDSFDLYLNFGVQAGDTILVPALQQLYPHPLYFQVMIDSISTIISSASDSIQVFYGKSYCNLIDVEVFDINIFEKVGYSGFMFFYEFSCSDSDIESWSLRCYSDADISVNFQPDELPCKRFPEVTEEPDRFAEFAPIGAEWVFDYEEYGEPRTNPFGYYVGYQTIRVVGDTIIQGKYSKQLHWEKIFIDTTVSVQDIDTIDEGFRYFHQQGDSIFYFDSDLDTFRFYIAFDVQVGDTILVPARGESSPEPLYFTFRIDSISVLKTDNQDSLRILYAYASCNRTNVHSKNIEIIKCIGVNSFMLFNESGCFFTGLPEWSLRCYNDDYINLNFQPEGQSCELLTSTDIILKEKKYIKLYPNPTVRRLTIVLPIADKYFFVNIYNINGQLIQKNIISDSSNELDISHLTSGNYWLRLSDEKEQTYGISPFTVIK